jgi:hypothetical protein
MFVDARKAPNEVQRLAGAGAAERLDFVGEISRLDNQCIASQ